jgi:hypothetical protein
MVASTSPRSFQFPRQIFALFALLPVLIYTIAHFFFVPYTGFDFNPTTGEVIEFEGTPPPGTLQRGDVLVQVGSIPWEAYNTDLRQPLIDPAEEGTLIPIRILRNGTEQQITWQLLPANSQSIALRFSTEWWIAWVFWGTGMLGFLFLRPHNTLRALFLTLCFLTAFWLAGESTVSRWHIWGGAIKLRAVSWLLAPAYFLFHWYFPRPLREIPRSVIHGSFGVAGILALAHTFQLLPKNAHAIPVLLALVSTIVLLGIHFVRQRSERRALGIVILGVILTVVPIIVASISLGISGTQSDITGLAFLAFPALPLAYFYATTRQNLGALETRANRAISLYIFLIILCTLALFITPILHAQTTDVSAHIIITLLLMAFIGVAVALFFIPFERWIERTVLGIPLPTRSLLETYGVEIASVLTTSELAILLHEQILRSLHVKEAQLLRIVDGVASELATYGNRTYQIPDSYTLKLFHENTAHYLPPDSTPLPFPYQWVRVILQLRGQNQIEGLWLLGARDPDDFYARKEIEMLNTVAVPSGVALTNILRAQQLRDMVQVNIARWDAEHKRIAHSLHDKVLQDLQVLYERMDKSHSDTPTRYDALTGYIRHLIAELRPPSLTYDIGLGDVIQGMVDEYAEQRPTIQWQYHPTGNDSLVYDEAVTENLYYIAKLACDNIAQHADATLATIRLQLTPTCIQLLIEDDGVGFDLEDPVSYGTILAGKHFGLFHMLERADMIGAKIRIQSRPKTGTRVSVEWQGHSIGESPPLD